MRLADPCSPVSRCCSRTRRYTITYRDGRRVEVDAEGMWPVFGALEFVVTVAVVGMPQQVVAQRVPVGAVASVEREDGAVWQP